MSDKITRVSELLRNEIHEAEERRRSIINRLSYDTLSNAHVHMLNSDLDVESGKIAELKHLQAEIERILKDE